MIWAHRAQGSEEEQDIHIVRAIWEQTTQNSSEHTVKKMAVSIVQAQPTNNRAPNRLIMQAVRYRWLGSTLLKCGQIWFHANCKARILEGEWGHSNPSLMGPSNSSEVFKVYPLPRWRE